VFTIMDSKSPLKKTKKETNGDDTNDDVKSEKSETTEGPEGQSEGTEVKSESDVAESNAAEPKSEKADDKSEAAEDAEKKLKTEDGAADALEKTADAPEKTADAPEKVADVTKKEKSSGDTTTVVKTEENGENKEGEKKEETEAVKKPATSTDVKSETAKTESQPADKVLVQDIKKEKEADEDSKANESIQSQVDTPTKQLDSSKVETVKKEMVVKEEIDDEEEGFDLDDELLEVDHEAEDPEECKSESGENKEEAEGKASLDLMNGMEDDSINLTIGEDEKKMLAGEDDVNDKDVKVLKNLEMKEARSRAAIETSGLVAFHLLHVQLI